MTREIRGPSREPTGGVSINGHIVKLLSQCFCLYPEICANFILDQRSFLHTGQSRNSCLAQVLRIMTVSASCQWVVYNDGLHPGLREHHRRVGGKDARVRR